MSKKNCIKSALNVLKLHAFDPLYAKWECYCIQCIENTNSIKLNTYFLLDTILASSECKIECLLLQDPDRNRDR